MDQLASLTPEIKHIIVDKGTEPAGSGQFIEAVKQGSYLCRRCGLALFRASNQFTSHCGWPSFDDQIKNTVKQQVDADQRRTEIVCARCDAHLGHVFSGENYTANNIRHCVNSLSIEFVEDNTVLDTETAIVAGGCFWGLEYYLKQIKGVLIAEVGYIGGEQARPTYEDICTKNTGHFEATRIVYDINQTDYTTILRAFFELHDPTQVDGQGPDIGPQYKSAVFYFNNKQHTIAQQLIQQLHHNGYKVATELKAMSVFWPAEEYHQAYYQKTGKQPYCHRPVKRF